jgi:Xaa-Pro aminopeptidase
MAKKTKQEVTEAQPTYPKMADTRLEQLHFMLEDTKTDAMVVSYLPNIRYLTNFSGSAATLFISKDEIHFISDDRYEEQIKTELFPLPNLKTYITRDPWKVAKDKGILKKIQTLAFESDRINYSDAVNIRNRIRPIKFKPVNNLVERFTMPKSPEELESIQKAADISVQVYEKILPMIKPGVTEKDIAIEIIYQTRKLGSEGDAFDIIVTSGPRGAIVHGKPTDKKIKSGDIVLMDFGCRVNGFCSDISRTVAVGKATKEQKQLYKIINSAKDAAIQTVKPGMNGKTLDHSARSIIEKEGFGKFFQHSLGHGIGLEDHEMPTITFRLDDQIIPEYSVLAIEPGVYLPDKYGMRIEDMVYITRYGAKMLTKAPDELPVV